MNAENWKADEDSGPTPEELEQERRAGLNILRLARGAFAAGESILEGMDGFMMPGGEAYTAYQNALIKLAAFKEALEMLHQEARRQT